MEKITKFAKTIRNNWKKSVAGTIALYFAIDKVKEKYDIYILMQAACKEAVKHGDGLIAYDRNPTLVTVILNPVANKRKAKQEFEKYCEPILHLAGIQLEVIQTLSEGHAKDVIENLKGTEAIIVAGGDGTLSEIVTGLMRRNDEANRFPLGILPLGRTNTIGNSLFPSYSYKGAGKVKQLIDASMAIVQANTIKKDALKIEPISKEGETPSRPIYAMSGIEWGAFRDAMAKRDKYWFLGSLREYAAFLFNGYKDTLTWNCSGTVKYTPPCSGCSNCIPKRQARKSSWSSYFMSAPTLAAENKVDEVNPYCNTTHELCFKCADFKIQTQNELEDRQSAISIAVGKNAYTYAEFVTAGWNRIKKRETTEPSIYARTVELIPKESDKEQMVEIDKEDFEAKPMKITILPKVIKLFCLPKPT